MLLYCSLFISTVAWSNSTRMWSTRRWPTLATTTGGPSPAECRWSRGRMGGDSGRGGGAGSGPAGAAAAGRRAGGGGRRGAAGAARPADAAVPMAAALLLLLLTLFFVYVLWINIFPDCGFVFGEISRLMKHFLLAYKLFLISKF